MKIEKRSPGADLLRRSMLPVLLFVTGVVGLSALVFNHSMHEQIYENNLRHTLLTAIGEELTPLSDGGDAGAAERVERARTTVRTLLDGGADPSGAAVPAADDEGLRELLLKTAALIEELARASRDGDPLHALRGAIVLETIRAATYVERREIESDQAAQRVFRAMAAMWGMVILIAVLASSVMERRRRHLIEGMERYRALIEASPHGIQESDTNGIITFSNAAHSRILACGDGALVGRYVWDTCPTEEERRGLRGRLEALVAGETKPTPHLERRRTFDGRIIDVQVDWNYKRDDAGRVTGFVSFITDVTERMRFERRMEELNRCFLEFGANSADNIERLTGLLGSVMEGEGAFYCRLEGDTLCRVGSWQAPPGFAEAGPADGCICSDVTENASQDPFYVADLRESRYAVTDPYVSKYGFRAYFGKAVKSRGEHVGSVCVVFRGEFAPTEEDERLLGIIASAIGIEEERIRGEEEIKAAKSELERLVVKMTSLEETERKRYAEMLHEGIGQHLIAVKFAFAATRRAPANGGSGALERLESLLDEALRATRSMTVALYPSFLDDTSLSGALRWFSRQVMEPSGMAVSLDIDPEADALCDEERKNLFRIIREAFQNARKYSGAANFSINCNRSNGALRLVASDDGKGFDYAVARVGGEHGLGLMLMEQWARSIGGAFSVETSPGKGTRVVVELGRNSRPGQGSDPRRTPAGRGDQ